MDKRGVALILAMFVIVAIAIIISASFFGTINENNLVNRHINSMRALWLAEAGLAEAIVTLDDVDEVEYNDPTYKYSANTTYLSGEYYQVNAKGKVTLPSAEIIREVKAIVKTLSVSADSFQHAIRTASSLTQQGSVSIGCDDPAYCVSPPYYEANADFTFPGLFNLGKEDLKSYSKVYTNPPVDVVLDPDEKLYWIDLPPDPITGIKQEFKISSNTWESGCGDDKICSPPNDTDNGAILIVDGPAEITGGEFYGIIYVTGKLRMSGNPIIHGTILAEAETEITTLTGNVTINHNRDAIEGAVNALSHQASAVASWEEIGYNP